ncbi:MAG: hypothetical protein A2W99_08630 [Bacteroidetes bacterium GWF2_33_16]|nr:MAG: hypothetical protein A2X00_00525 [Bacteroidetes bacterium GWE2_32_14]OFY05565.1 MAG: hypothetical protein A2W99_08630 [Bacteroidetes bacterium GWF2_33_16]
MLIMHLINYKKGMNKYFNIKRFANLVKRELHSNMKRNLLIIGAMFSIFTISAFLVFELGEEITSEITFEKFHSMVFLGMLFTGGAFLASFSFIELRNKINAHFYLLTPGSSLEKLLVNLLISLVGFIVFMMLFYFLYSQVFNWIVSAIFGYQFSNVDFLHEEVISSIQVFISVHSIFLLGAISFKKYPVILTPIFIFLVNITLFGFVRLVGFAVFGDFDIDNQLFSKEIFDKLNLYSKIIIIYIIPPVLWFVTYLKLNEKEL